MQKFPTREEVLAEARARLGGYGSGRRLAKIARVSHISGAKWLRDGVPPERVGLITALTGIPAHEIRPDVFVPPPLDLEGEAYSQAHGRSVSGGAVA